MDEQQNPHPGFVDLPRDNDAKSSIRPHLILEVYCRTEEDGPNGDDPDCCVVVTNRGNISVLTTRTEVLRRIAAAESVKPRVITMDEVERAAKASYERQWADLGLRGSHWEGIPAKNKAELIKDQCAALRALGIKVEEAR